MENLKISKIEELQIICVNTQPSKCESTNSYSLNAAWMQWIPPNEYNTKKKKKKDGQLEKLEGQLESNRETGQTLPQTGHQD